MTCNYKLAFMKISQLTNTFKEFILDILRRKLSYQKLIKLTVDHIF